MKMLEFKKILVPYDGSSYAKKALAVAADTARLIPGAELFVATVAPAEEPKEKVRITKSAAPDEPPPKNPGEILLDEADKLVPEEIPRHLILRVGDPGEELVALLPDTDAAGARLIGQRVVDSVAGVALPHTASDAAAVVTLSVGVACEVPLGHNPDAAAKLLLAAADAALYAAKHAGRNRVGVAPPAGVPAD